MRGSAATLAVLGLLGAAPLASAQTSAVAVQHDAVGCVVAGKFPILSACFTPASDLAKARVYFRAHGKPHWYYVDMVSDAPCFKGTLPKPKKEIEFLDYYVE